jgi:hypothetical protein
MNPVPGYPLGVPPSAPSYNYGTLPAVPAEPVFGPSGTMMPGFNRVP